MRKILIVAMNYAPEMTGCGKYTGDLGAAMAQRGHEIDVITCVPHYPGWSVRQPYVNQYVREELDGVTVYRCPVLLPTVMGGFWRLISPLSFAVTSAPVALWKIFTSRPDTVLLIEPTLFAAPIVLLAAKLIRARTVLHVQDLEVDAAFAVGHLTAKPWLTKLGLWFERACLKAFDQIVTISFKMAEKIAEKGVANNSISVVRNWVDLDHIKPIEKSVSYRDELGIPRNAFVVLYSGNIGPKQGLDVVIDAARLLRKVPSILFVIAGEGPSKADLEKRSLELGNVCFLPFQPYEKLGEFLGLCDLHILPQIANAGDLVLPSKLGGMLASGRPIVVTAEPQTELAQCLEGAAMIVPPENATALAETIRTIAMTASAGDPSIRQDLARELARPSAMDRLEGFLITQTT